MAISPQNNENFLFYTGKLYGLTGMKTAGKKQKNQAHTYDKEDITHILYHKGPLFVFVLRVA